VLVIFRLAVMGTPPLVPVIGAVLIMVLPLPSEVAVWLMGPVVVVAKEEVERPEVSVTEIKFRARVSDGSGV